MTRALVALVALALAFPAASLAQAPQTNAPPGNSAIDEYLETVPGATGNAPPRPLEGSDGGGGLSAAERARLEALGPDGETLANAVDATSPAKPKGSSTSSEPAAPQGDGRSPLDAVAGTIGGSDGGDGMGIVLPAILIGSLLAAIAFVLLRRRAAS